MAGVLDTDVGALVPLARGFLDWWGAELAEVARPLVRERHLKGAAVVAVPAPEGGYALLRLGERIGVADPTRPVRAALTLPAEAVLTRSVPTPGLSERDWRRILANDIDRLTPFDASTVYFTQRFETAGDGGRRAELAVVARATAEAAIRQAMAGGVLPTALMVEGADAQPLDLLSAVRASGGLGAAKGGGRRWWWVVALLVMLNVGAAALRDVRDTSRLQAMADQQQPVVDQLQHLRLQVSREADRRRRLLAARAATSPLRVLEAASIALPDGAWVQRLSLDGEALRLTGYHRPGLDVSAALQASPVFADVRAASADLTAAAPSGATEPADPFDVNASVRPPPLPASTR